VIGSAMRGSVHADVDAGIWDLEFGYMAWGKCVATLCSQGVGVVGPCLYIM